MIKCQNCQAEVSAKDRFCEACGHKLAAAVSKGVIATPKLGGCACPPGQSQPDSAGYCTECGKLIVAHKSSPAESHIEEMPDDALAMVTDVGRRHPVNEDAGAVVRVGNGDTIMVVADGVSSSWNAVGASHTATRVVRDGLAAHAAGAAAVAPAATQMMREVIAQAHNAVMALPTQPATVDMDEPECTIVAALIRDSQVVIGWVGDSRAYLLAADGPDNAIVPERLLTCDDSWFEEVVSAGQLSPAQALADRRAHSVTQVLGMRDAPINVHVIQITLVLGQSLLLCSDGLWNYLNRSGDLAQAVRQCPPNSPAIAICRHLVDLANAHGGRDNITVAIRKG